MDMLNYIIINSFLDFKKIVILLVSWRLIPKHTTIFGKFI